MISILLYGFLFGLALQSAGLNHYNTISGMATLDNYKVAKAIALAIGAGVILLNIEIGLGLASYHTKPFIAGGVMIGGLVFGTGMAILGYCPGTMLVSLGQGSLDAVVGLIGALAGGLVYTVVVPFISGILGPDLGNISLNSWLGPTPALFYTVAILLGLCFIAIAFWVHKIEKVNDRTWIVAGLAIALLNCIIFLKAGMDRVIGASTAYPYLADSIFGVTANDYFAKIQKPGSWEVIFLGGTMLSGLILSLIKKEFKIQLIHDNWKKYRGINPGSRIFWAFTGGFILIFGARMAGGCTSGHVISGGMQLAVSSLVFALFVFAGLLTTGWLFYKRK
jgi:uncharacterized membrane protein YedE/YeeE